MSTMRLRRAMACSGSILDCGEAGGTSANHCNPTNLLRYCHHKTEDCKLLTEKGACVFATLDSEFNNGGKGLSQIYGGWPEMRGPRGRQLREE